MQKSDQVDWLHANQIKTQDLGFFIEVQFFDHNSPWLTRWESSPLYAYCGQVIYQSGGHRTPCLAEIRPICFSSASNRIVHELCTIQVPVDEFQFRKAAVLNSHAGYSNGCDYAHLPAWKRELR